MASRETATTTPQRRAWEADSDIDCVAGQTSPVLEVHDDGNPHTLTQGIVLAGATTNASYFRAIRAAAGDAPLGLPGSGARFELDFTGGQAIVVEISEANFHLHDVGVKITGSTTFSLIGAAFYTGGSGEMAGVVAYDCDSAGVGGGFGLVHSLGDDNCYFVDCLAIDCESDGFLFNTAMVNCAVYNCTSKGNGASGFNNTMSTVTVKNGLGDGNTTADFTGTYEAESANNASSDATAPGSSARQNQTFAYADAGARNYHLAANDLAAFGHGVDLSDDATFEFDDDIDGERISGVWSIGMDWRAPGNGVLTSARRIGLNEDISSFGESGNGYDYTSAAAWEADSDIDCVAGQTSPVLEVHNDGNPHTLTQGIVIAGATTNGAYFRSVRAAAGSEPRGLPQRGARFELDYIGGQQFVFEISEANVHLHDIGLKITGSTTFSLIGATFYTGGSGEMAGVVAYDCDNSGTGGGFGLVHSLGDDNCYFVDCLVIDCKSDGFLFNTAAVNCAVYNCTSKDNGASGFNRTNGAVTLKNCLGDGNTTADFTGTYEAASTTNASSDATAPGGAARQNQTVTYADASARNYHLSSLDTACYGLGADLSSDERFPFADDMDRQSIIAWSIGADAQATGTLTPNHTYQHRHWGGHHLSYSA